MTSIAIGCIAALLQAAFGRPLACGQLADNRLVVMSLVPALLPAATRRRSGTGAGPAHPQSRSIGRWQWRTVIGQGLGDC